MKQNYWWSEKLGGTMFLFSVAEVVSAVLAKYLSPVVGVGGGLDVVARSVCAVSLAGTLGCALGLLACAPAHIIAGATARAWHVFWLAMSVFVTLSPLGWLASDLAWRTVNVSSGTLTDVPFFEYIPFLFLPVAIAKAAMLAVVEGRRQMDRAEAAKSEKEAFEEAEAREARRMAIARPLAASAALKTAVMTTLALGPVGGVAPPATRAVAEAPNLTVTGDGNRISRAQKAPREERIRALLKAGRTPVQIIAETGFPRSSTYKIIAKLRETPLGLA